MEHIEYSNIGNREQNQDFILFQSLGENQALFIVADGMGGYSNGALAAKTAAETIVEAVVDGRSIPDSVKIANQKLKQVMWETGASKMGCCIAGIMIDGLSGTIFWVGDSRVYIYRNGKQRFVTEDHSLVMQLEKQKKLTFAQRERYGHIVSRAIMGTDDDTVDEMNIPLESGDEIILCSDGLHKILPIDLLLDMIHSNTLQLESQNDDFDDNHSFIYIKV